eukprot:s929_g8.t3
MSEVFLYLAFNLTMNIFAVLVIKHGSAALSFLVSTLRMPLSALAFGSTLIMGSEAVTPQLHDLLSLVVILLGLCSYRMGARQLKRQQKEESAMSQVWNDPVGWWHFSAVAICEEDISVVGADPEPNLCQPLVVAREHAGLPRHSSQRQRMEVHARLCHGQYQQWSTAVRARPCPEAAGAVGRCGAADADRAPRCWITTPFAPVQGPFLTWILPGACGSAGVPRHAHDGPGAMRVPRTLVCMTFEFTCLNRRRWIDVTADTFRAQHAYACAAVLLAGSASTYPLLVLVFRWGPTCPKEHFRTSAIAQSSRRHEC